MLIDARLRGHRPDYIARFQQDILIDLKPKQGLEDIDDLGDPVDGPIEWNTASAAAMPKPSTPFKEP